MDIKKWIKNVWYEYEALGLVFIGLMLMLILFVVGMKFR